MSLPFGLKATEPIHPSCPLKVAKGGWAEEVARQEPTAENVRKNRTLTLTGLKSGQQVTNWSHTFLEGVHRAAKLLQDGEVQVGHGPLVLGPLDVLAMLEAQGLAAGQNGREARSDVAGRLGAAKEDCGMVEQGAVGCP